MARQKNTARRDEITSLYDVLLVDFITREATITQIAAKLAMSPHTVRYYLKNPGTPPRVVYSEHIRQKVALMDLSEIKIYALKLGRPWQRLYQIALNARKPHQNISIREDQQNLRRERITLFKVLDFSSAADLQVFGLTLSDVLAAKKTLRAMWGLTLAAPNHLVDKKGNRRFDLDYQAQIQIVRHPAIFVQTHAAEIGRGWQPYDDTKTYVELLDL